MLAIQTDAAGGRPVLLEKVGREFIHVTFDRWREIVGEEIDLEETPHPIIPVEIKTAPAE